MLQVETYLDRSGVHGFGVFAARDIPEGTLIWEFTEGVDLALSPENLEKLAPVPRKFMAHYGNWTFWGYHLLCCDNARFMNHSTNPNVDSASVQNVALRDIAAGEEIVCDYREFDATFDTFEPGAAATSTS